MKVTTNLLIDMLSFMRPAYSDTEADFCRTYLQPVFGEPDRHGNYIKVIGKKPHIAFTAHTDTVHNVDGIQLTHIEDDFVSTMNGSCLGADCTTGLWLMLGMIEEGIEGVYVAHAAEEIGGIGSTALVMDNPAWLGDIQACISFDRYGTESIITHQSGIRTASDEFAYSLADALNMPFLKPDTGGTYTDSLEYSHIVPECTNISVGYYSQHTKAELQDLLFSSSLLERLKEADWSRLVILREPTPLDGIYSNVEILNVRGMQEIIEDYPERIAYLLDTYGFTADDLANDIGIDTKDQYA